MVAGKERGREGVVDVVVKLRLKLTGFLRGINIVFSRKDTRGHCNYHPNQPKLRHTYLLVHQLNSSKLKIFHFHSPA